VGVTR
jgi:hypothetical protein